MSYFTVECPWCGQSYTSGVVGSTLVGSGHSCQLRQECQEPGCERSGTFYASTPASPALEEAGSQRMRVSSRSPLEEDFGFFCPAHLEGRTILMHQASSQGEE